MLRRRLLLAVFLISLAPAGARAAADSAAVGRGEYLFHAAGCYGCHTDVKNKGARLAGGRQMKTRFGTFYGPNITPHRETGIGGWSAADFHRALRDGVSPAGAAYYPAFPYTSYTGMTDDDIADLWAYLQTVEPSATDPPDHELAFPYSQRWLMGMWRALYFSRGPFDAETPAPDGVDNAAIWRRGAYLVRALGHCGECHSPRADLGSIDATRELAGNIDGPDGGVVSNITPHRGTGIGGWSTADLSTYLEIGMDPEGDFVGGAMAEVVEYTTGKMTPEDRAAIIGYLRALAPIDHKITKPKP